MARWGLMAFLLLTALMLAVESRVEKQVSSECRDFLYSKTLPTGYDSKQLHYICQSYNNRPRYLTLYNTAERIPVYSAYVFKSSEGEKCADIPWMYEPQVKKTRWADIIQLESLYLLSYLLSSPAAIYIFRHRRHAAFPSELHTHEF